MIALVSRKRKVFFAYGNMGDTTDAVSIAVRQLAEGLSARGYPVQILLGRSVRKNSLPSVLRVMSEFGFLVRIALRAMYMRSGNGSFIITLDSPVGLGLVGRAIDILSAGRVAHVAWTMDLYGLKRAQSSDANLLMNAYARVERASVARSSRVVAIGDCMVGRIHQLCNRSSVSIPIWQDSEAFDNSSQSVEADVRSQFKIEDKFVVLYSGTARELHPLQALLDAALELRVEKSLHFLLVGRGVELQRIRSRAIELGLTNVTFGDFLDVVSAKALAKVADVHIVSLAEDATGTCVPSKGYAAMAARKPVIFLGSPDSQIAVDLRNSRSGLVLSSDDSDGLVSCLTDLAENPSTVAAMGARGREFLEQCRSPMAGAQGWDVFLSSVVTKGSGSPKF